MGTAILAFIIVGILSFPILIIWNYLDKRKGNFSKLNTHGRLFFSELEKIRDDFKSLTFSESVGLFNKLTGLNANNLNEVYQLTGLQKYENAKENSADEKFYDYVTDLVFNLDRRHSFYFEKLDFKDADEAYKDYGINLKDNELLFDRLTKVDLWEEKVVGSNLSYNGFSYSFGSVGKSMVGSRNIKRIPVTQFVHVDRGDLYTTNQRLIFIGKEKNTNKTIVLDNILNLSIDEDSVILGIPNGKKPMIKFEPYTNTLKKRDHLIRFVSILDRLISNS